MENESMVTSIMLRRDTKSELDKLKIHPRQSYNDVVSLLIEKINWD